jgi:hypothetical protein
LSEERGEGLAISEGHNPNFYGAARAWCRGATMAEIGEQIELSEGDLVMTFNKTIDLMRQVAEMLTHVKPEHPLRSRLRQAETMLKRDIVEHSLALGFAPIELPEIARGELEAARAERPARRRPGERAPNPDADQTPPPRKKRAGKSAQALGLGEEHAVRPANGRTARKPNRTTGKAVKAPATPPRQKRKSRRDGGNQTPG